MPRHCRPLATGTFPNFDHVIRPLTSDRRLRASKFQSLATPKLGKAGELLTIPQERKCYEN